MTDKSAIELPHFSRQDKKKCSMWTSWPSCQFDNRVNRSSQFAAPRNLFDFRTAIYPRDETADQSMRLYIVHCSQPSKRESQCLACLERFRQLPLMWIRLKDLGLLQHALLCVILILGFFLGLVIIGMRQRNRICILIKY